MDRYTGPKSRIARKFGEGIFGADMVIQEKEKLLNMVCNFVKSRKLNTPMEF